MLSSHGQSACYSPIGRISGQWRKVLHCKGGAIMCGIPNGAIDFNAVINGKGAIWPGDFVKCVDASESCGHLVEGQTYRIAMIGVHTGYNAVILASYPHAWNVNRFQKVQQ
jgi:hypothetical protein